ASARTRTPQTATFSSTAIPSWRMSGWLEAAQATASSTGPQWATTRRARCSDRSGPPSRASRWPPNRSSSSGLCTDPLPDDTQRSTPAPCGSGRRRSADARPSPPHSFRVSDGTCVGLRGTCCKIFQVRRRLSSTVMTVQREQQGHRGAFFIDQDGVRAASLTFSAGPDGKLVMLDHTEVGESLRGQGIARKLVEAAVMWARQEKIKLVP